ncbi:hypothetical protein AB0E96_33615 [Kitasatospora sp. NPDC036755]|uniref:hypothetical protein n=1 Tax=Kitasatospora sp. NPDC036755 TaxID=3154600 RepID=UPI0033E43D2B
MDVAGKWNISVNTPIGRQEAALLIVADGDDLTGTSTSAGTTLALQEGKLEDNVITFKVRLVKPMPMDCRYTLTVTGDTLIGDVKLGAFGKAKVTGSRA